MTTPKKEKKFFTHFPPPLKWTMLGVFILLLGYPIIYKIYQHTLNERKRISIPVRNGENIDAAVPTEVPPQQSVDGSFLEEVGKEAAASPTQQKKTPKSKVDLRPIVEGLTLSFAYNSLSQKVLFGAPYQQELEFFKSVSGNTFDTIPLDYLEKCAPTGVRTFQELEIDLLHLSKKIKHPKKAAEEAVLDQKEGWTDRIKRYLMSLVHVEKNDDPQREIILLKLSDVFLMIQNKDLKEAITLMVNMTQNTLIEGAPWVEKAKNLEGVLSELTALYALVVKNLDRTKAKIKGGSL